MAADGNALVWAFYAGTGMSTGIYYYDAGAKQIRSAEANSAGSVGTGVCFKKKGEWHISGTGSLADGTKTEGESSLVLSDDGNTATWSRASTVAGRKAPRRMYGGAQPSSEGKHHTTEQLGQGFGPAFSPVNRLGMPGTGFLSVSFRV